MRSFNATIWLVPKGTHSPMSAYTSPNVTASDVFLVMLVAPNAHSWALSALLRSWTL